MFNIDYHLVNHHMGFLILLLQINPLLVFLQMVFYERYKYVFSNLVNDPFINDNFYNNRINNNITSSHNIYIILYNRLYLIII